MSELEETDAPTQAFALTATQLDGESDAPMEDATQRVPLAEEHAKGEEEEEEPPNQAETQPVEEVGAQQSPDNDDAIQSVAVDKESDAAPEQTGTSEIAADAEFVPFTAGEGDDIDLVPEIPITAQEPIEAVPLPSSLLVE